MNKEECNNCRFFFKASSGTPGAGACRRFPPVFVNTTQQMFDPSNIGRAASRQVTAITFPEVHHSSWCGEWQPRMEVVNNDQAN